MDHRVMSVVLGAVVSVFLASGSSAEGVKFNGVFAPSEGFVNRLEKPLRAEVCLNGRWDFQGFKTPAGWRDGKGQPCPRRREQLRTQQPRRQRACACGPPGSAERFS